MPRLPEFLLIGSPKSGTTTLYEYLTRHPQIFMGTVKEPGFFVDVQYRVHKPFWRKLINQNDEYIIAPSEIRQKGLDWYCSLFAEAKPDQVCGEGTQIYSHWPRFQSAKLIAETLPNAKFIYLMRDPIKRAYSHYVEMKKQMFYNDGDAEIYYTFEDAIKHNPYVIDTSNYMLQIEQYLKYYDKKHFLFLFMDDFIKDPASTLKQVCEFIGVEAIDLVMGNPVHSNKMDDFENQLISHQIEKAKAKLPNFLTSDTSFVPKKIRDKLHQIIANRMKTLYSQKPMLKETHLMLLEKFREPNQRLSEFLGRDLSSWNAYNP